MKQYYNVGATLPFLGYDRDSFPSPRNFLETCAPWLSTTDYSLLERILAANPHDGTAAETAGEVLPAYAAFEDSLRRQLKVHRNSRFHRGDTDPVVESVFVPDAERAAAEAIAQSDPLGAENVLDQARWSKLEELNIGHYFNITYLTVYALQLQLLVRASRFTRERGGEHFAAAYSAVWSDIQQHVPKTESGVNV